MLCQSYTWKLNIHTLVNSLYRFTVIIVNEKKKPVMPVSVASDMVGVCGRTLHLWEKHGLITPARDSRSDRRLYSFADIERLKYIKHLLDDEGLNISGVKRFLRFFDRCESKECPNIDECRKNLEFKEE